MSFKITKSKSGQIRWREFENPHLGIKKGLVFDISIKVDFEVDDKQSEGIIQLNFIRLNDIKLRTEGFLKRKKFINWSELGNKSYTFPTNPKPGYIDGSFYLIQHNPCDVTHLKFGKYQDNKLEISVTGLIDFAYEKVDSETKVKKYEFSDLRTELVIGSSS